MPTEHPTDYTTPQAARLLGLSTEALRKRIERAGDDVRKRIFKAPNGRDWLIPEDVLPMLGFVVGGRGSDEAMLTAAFVDRMIDARVAEARLELPRDAQEALDRAEAAAIERTIERTTAVRQRDEEARLKEAAEAALQEALATVETTRARLQRLELAATRAVSIRNPWRRRRELRRLARVLQPEAMD